MYAIISEESFQVAEFWDETQVQCWVQCRIKLHCSSGMAFFYFLEIYILIYSMNKYVVTANIFRLENKQ